MSKPGDSVLGVRSPSGGSQMVRPGSILNGRTNSGTTQHERSSGGSSGMVHPLQRGGSELGDSHREAHQRAVAVEPHTPHSATTSTETQANRVSDLLKTFRSGVVDRRPATENITQDLDGVRTLADSGKWKSGLEIIQVAVTKQNPPHISLCIKAWMVLTLLRLRHSDQALQQMNAIGDLSSPQYRYESHQQYEGIKGSFVPFSLTLLHALLPLLTSGKFTDKTAVDNLYGLERSLVEEIEGSTVDQATTLTLPNPTTLNILDLIPCPNPSENEHTKESKITMIYSRLISVRSCITCLHLHRDEPDLALLMMKKVQSQYPRSARFHAEVAKLQLNIGDFDQAKVSFSNSDSLLGPRPEENALFWMNSGLVCMTEGKYPEAAEDFAAARSIEPTNMAAVNNLAAALLYSCRARDAIEVLETAIKEYPSLALNECLVFNLATLWELASDDVVVRKTMLNSFVTEFGPDHFDRSSLKLSS